ncbi:NUDIX hydrolase 2-like protein isoform X1 [Tanacetum coccineum]
MDQLTNKNGVEKVQLLPAIDDNYGGVEVELKERMDSDVFLARLKASMLEWTLQGKRGVWIKLPIDLVNLVESTVKEGFRYHHAEPDYLMLVKWIPETINTIPANASHRVGIGAIVLNDKREMLVVQEKNGILRGSGIWKIPTGIVEEAEEISEGAVREVKEETGIDAEFVEILAFRQWHKAFFRKSDLFFVCMMRPSSFDIQIQESEIEAAKWIPLEEFAAQPSAQKQGSLMRYICGS